MVLRALSILLTFSLLAATQVATAVAATTAEPDPTQVATAMAEGTSTAVTGASWVTRPPLNAPSAVSDVATLGLPNAGSRFAVLSTGSADALLSGPQTYSASVNNGGDARAGGSDRDAIVLKVDIKVPQGANCMSFAFRFASDEYPEYVGKSFNDGFIAELDSNSWTTSGTTISAPGNFAFDPTGAVVSVNATGATTVKAEEAAGTIYDGGTPILYAATPVTPGDHSLYLSLFDVGDASLDSAVLLDNLVVGTAAAGACKGGATIAPPPTAAPAPTQPAATKPAIFGPAGIVTAPSNKKCISRRNFRIRIKKRAGLTYIAAFVWVNGKRVATRRGSRITAPIDLRGLPKGKYTVKIRVVTSTGQVINGTRRYRTCTKKAKTPGRRPL
ncbi:MAG: choice-of-anchor L domain-containing protein [Baekduia sp.]